jgi:predicted transcriptional regulator of viral defense system
MKYFSEFANLKCFTFSEAKEIVGTEKNALSVLSSYVQKRLVAKVKRGLYVVLEDGFSVANQYEIASKISLDAVITNHSALSYFGYTNQVSYEMYVATQKRFRTFKFEGYTYTRVIPTIKDGVLQKNNLRVTNIERTILDCINNFYLCLDFEEFYKALKDISFLDENKMRQYLPQYGKKVIYQKTGFIFEKVKEEFNISDGFLDFCKINSGTLEYLLPESKKRKNLYFDKNWNLMVPKDLWQSVYKAEADFYEL